MKIINIFVQSDGGAHEFEIAINDAGELFDPWKTGGALMAGDEVSVAGCGDPELPLANVTRWHLTATTRDQLQ